jgi:putative ABC transport system permease protein
MLIKHKSFTAVAVIALTLGIGANTAIFSLVNGVLLRPLPFPDAEQIVYFEGQNPSQGITDSNISMPDYNDWAKQTDLFGHTAVYAVGNANLAADGAEPERVPRAFVSSGFFAVLGVQPVIGRAFLPEEDRPKVEPIAILSNGVWKRRFGSDRDIVGKKISISARPVTVIGVMPAGFEFPEQTQVWSNLSPDPAEEVRDNRSLSSIARLKPGVSRDEAQSRISTINAQLAQSFPDTNKGWDAKLSVLHDRLVREVRPSLMALLGAVAFVLLIACANVANLLLARAAARQKEVAIRTAMGASRGRIIRQMLTESMLLSIIGGVLGVMLSVWLVDLLLSITPKGAPRMEQVRLDYTVLAFATAISVLTGLIFGLAPALQTSKLDVSGSLKEGGRAGEGHRQTKARSLLLIGEIALSLMLLVGSGLLIKSFMRLQNVSPGFNPQNVLVMSTALPGAKYKDEAQRPEFFRQLVERLKVLPGIQAVGGGVSLPLAASNYNIGRAFIPEGRPLTIDESKDAGFSAITGDYFSALQIPLIAGRVLNEHDTANTPKVCIINESLAKRHFGSVQDALGKRLTIWRDEKFPREIVGVVGDTKFAMVETTSRAQIYVPHTQDPSWNFMALVIRTTGDPTAVTPAVRHEVQAIDKDQPVYNVRTMEDVVMNSIGTRRVSMLLFTVFAGAALLLAAVGIYGVMAYSVTQRTQEIGIRMALGAQKSDVLKLVVKQGMSLTLIGVIVGLAGSFGLARMLASLLFGVGATDPLTFFGVSILLGFVAFLACYLPARRAAKLNPTIALATH